MCAASMESCSATFYNWKAKCGGLEVSDARKLKVLSDENAKLKKLLAEAMLDNAILKDVAAQVSALRHRFEQRQANVDARRKAGGCGARLPVTWCEPAAGV